MYLAPFKANGKPLQVQGFLSAFERTARRNAATLSALSAYGVALVGLDPAMTLVYRQEYAKLLGDRAPQVMLPQEWLASLPQGQDAAERSAQAPFHLLAHCTEKTNAPAAVGLWQTVFARHGLSLTVADSGCCGMSGTYGHEARNVETSRIIYAQSWDAIVQRHPGALTDTSPSKRGQASDMRHADAVPVAARGTASALSPVLLADGYSCRSQVDRLAGRTLAHPLQALLTVMRTRSNQSKP